jgi:site-specific recombinase XerD
MLPITALLGSQPMTSLVAVSSTLPALLQPVAEQARQMIRNRHASSTRRAYAADVLVFRAWAEQHGLQTVPAAPEAVALFLTAEATDGRKPSTLSRRMAAIRYIHTEAGLSNPCESDVVKATMAGIRRTAGVAQRQVAPATADRLRAMLDACGNDLQGLRDRALLALGFGGAFRRSELVGLTVADIEPTDEGVLVRLARSKTDQDGAGQKVPVLDGPRLRVKAALQDWMTVAGITEGPVFRTLARGGKVLPRAITDRSVADIVKKRAEQVGLDPALFSGHSLRAGFLTSAAGSGATVFAMMTVSRHRKVDTLSGYVRTAQAFKDHAGSAFM